MTNWIPFSYLNEVCFLSLNEDDKKYQMVLKVSQDEFKDILGAEFFEELDDQITNATLTTDNDTLYEDYIKDALAWLTYYNYTRFSNFNPTPTGLREFNDENSSVLSDVKMYSAEKNVYNMFTRYKNRMLNFLKLEQEKDSTKYPKYDKKCRDEFGFAISVIDKKSDALLKVNKSTIVNE